MPERSKRLRILAGPNGSGKSTIVNKIRSSYYCGYFVNADEIQAILDEKKVLNLNSNYGLEVHPTSFEKYLSSENARQRGYKNYLYFVCTVSPLINIARVAQRVQLGGHDVPSDKIESRYYSSLALLSDLIPHTYHTYLFDNSSEDSEIRLVAEIENGSAFIPKTVEIPWWVDEYVVSKLFI